MSPILVLRPAPGVLAPIVAERPVGNLLGVGEWTAAVFARGGETELASMPFSSISGERVRGSKAGRVTLTLDGIDAECAPLVRSMAAHPRAHELHLYRDSGREWLGPVDRLTFPAGGGSVSVEAGDVSIWTEARRLPRTRWFSTDAAEVYAELADAAFEVDPSPNATVAWAPVGTLIDRTYYVPPARTIEPLLSELVAAGCPATVLGRTIWVGAAIPLPTRPIRLIDAHFAQAPAVSVDASAQRNSVVVAGGQSSETFDPVSEVAVDEASVIIDGALEGVVRDARVTTSGVARQRAAALVGAGVPVQFSGGSLDPSAPVMFGELVPGARIAAALSETPAPVAGVYELVRMTFSATRDAEQVGIEVQPMVVDAGES